MFTFKVQIHIQSFRLEFAHRKSACGLMRFELSCVQSTLFINIFVSCFFQRFR